MNEPLAFTSLYTSVIFKIYLCMATLSSKKALGMAYLRIRRLLEFREVNRNALGWAFPTACYMCPWGVSKYCCKEVGTVSNSRKCQA